MHSPSPSMFSTMTHGYLRHHRREDAIGTIKIMKSRLASEHISHSLPLLDLSNAFCSLLREQMDAQLAQIVFAGDRYIAQTRCQQVYLLIAQTRPSVFHQAAEASKSTLLWVSRGWQAFHLL